MEGFTADARGWLPSTRLLAVLVLTALPIYGICLGANSIWDANEAFYVETPRQMVATGDYITPVFNGAPRVNKPVLSYWVVAGLYKVLGVSVTSERIGIAVGALGIIAAAFFIGRALRSQATGLLAALVVATAPRMAMFSRRIFIDIYITLFMSLALACFVLAERHPAHRRRYLLLTYAAMGLGVLTKGPIAIVIPALAVTAWWTIERRWSDLRRALVLPGLLIIAAIVVPWYAALVAAHGWSPVRDFLVGENLERYTTSLMPGERPIWYYVPVLLGDLFPWAPLILLPLVTAWRPVRPGEDTAHGAIRRLLWLWVVVIVGVFSLSRTKQDLYIFPIVPAVAALVADALVDAWRGHRRRAVPAVLAGIAAICLVCSPIVYRLFGPGAGYYALSGATTAALVLGVGAVAMIGALLWRGVPAAVVTLAMTFVAFNYVFVAWILPGMERLKPVVPIAQVLAARAAPTDQVGSYQMMLPSLVYYAGRSIRVLGSETEALEFYRGPSGAWALMSQTEWNQLEPQLPTLCIAARRPLFDVRLRDVINHRPPPDVLLVTNRCPG